MQDNQFINWCDRVNFFSFCALIFFLPISKAMLETFSSIIITTFFVKRIYFFVQDYKISKSAFAELSIIRKFMRFFDHFRPIPSYLNIAVGFYLLACLASTIFSHYFALSLKGFIFKIFEGAILLFAFHESVQTKRHLKIFLTSFCASILLIVINGFIQYFGGEGIIRGFSLTVDKRVMSSFKHPNDFGGYLIVAISFLLSFVVAQYKRLGSITSSNKLSNFDRFFYSRSFKVGLISLFVFSLISIGLTYSRGAWLALWAGLLFFGCRNLKVFLSIIFVIGLFALVFMPRLVAVRDVSFGSDDYIRTVEREEVRSENFIDSIYLRTSYFFNNFGGMGRKDFWKQATNIIFQYPILGSGPNTYAKTAPEFTDNWHGYYAHNCFLQLAAEIGMLGLFAFLLIFWRLFRFSIKYVSLMKDPFLTSVSWGALSAVLGYLCHSFVDTNIFSVQLGALIWVITGVVFVTQRLGVPGLVDEHVLTWGRRTFLPVVICSFLLIVCGLGIIRHNLPNPVYSEAFYAKGTDFFNQGQWANAEKYFLKSIDMNRANSKSYNALGNLLRVRSDFQRAMRNFEKAIKVDPEFDLAYFNLGLTYYQLKDYDNAIGLFKKAILYGKYGSISEYRYNLGLAYLQVGQRDNSLNEVSKIRKGDRPDLAKILAEKIESESF